MSNKLFFTAFLSLFTTLFNISFAEENIERVENNYTNSATVQQFIKKFSQENNIPQSELHKLFSQVKRNDEILQKISKPAEKTKPWYEYKKIFSDEERLNRGIEFYRRNRQNLQKAQEIYGVDAAIITAIIGVETRYGAFTGKYEVLEALSTLCFDYPPRAEFFCSELEQFIKLAKREKWNFAEIKGSYAGAMGISQFMPSSYWNDGVDADFDGKVDLWKSEADAIASVGNYLKNRGWKKGGDFYYLLPNNSLNDGLEIGKLSQANSTLQQLSQRNNWQNLPQINSDETQFATLKLEDEDKILNYLIFNNFVVITRYNSSPMYAMSVINLANKIRSNVEN
ncbi:MAG: lytic murein transglycosylase B [Cardiobacteriaceae bacterium]|nr:lytic murein transglycosylase B [Cardiobacteriaceae bacterium]